MLALQLCIFLFRYVNFLSICNVTLSLLLAVQVSYHHYD